MIWEQKRIKPLEAMTRTGFFVSLCSYIGFWLADVIEPGFVSRYFSVHIFLLASLVFGFLWATVLEEYSSRPLFQMAASLLCGLVLVMLTWGLTEGLDVYRLPVLVLSLMTPTILYLLIRS